MSEARKVTIGADPEIPVCLMETGLVHEWVPATGLFGGDKGKPVPQGEAGGWLEDGAMLELNPTPSDNPFTLADNITTLVTAATKHVAKHKHLDPSSKKELPLSLYPGGVTIQLRAEVLDKYPQLKVFGCAQDFSAYTPGVPRTGTMDRAAEDLGASVRFAGGHLHLGIENWPEELPKFIAVKFIDLFFLYPYLRNFSRHNDRDAYYGKPGLYRETSYGIEYRTPCPSWMRGNGGMVDTRVLMRFFEIGMLFARFEEYKPYLIELYNKVPWHVLYEAMEHRNFDGMHECLTAVDLIHGEAQAIAVGDRYINLRSFSERGKPGIFPRELFPQVKQFHQTDSPKKAAKNLYASASTLSTTATEFSFGAAAAEVERWRVAQNQAAGAEVDPELLRIMREEAMNRAVRGLAAEARVQQGRWEAELVARQVPGIVIDDAPEGNNGG